MSELTPEQIEALKKAASDSQLVKETLKSNGWKILEERIKNRIADKKNLWLKAKSSEAAEIIRIKASVYDEIFEIAKKIILEGKNAQQILAQNPNIS